MKVVLLTNFIPPYRVPFYQELNKRLENFEIFISTRMEKNRHWPVEWGGLSVKVQKTLTIPYTWKHIYGFTEQAFVHIPLDTLRILRKSKADWIITSEFGPRTILATIFHQFHPKNKLAVWATLSEYSEMGRGFVRTLVRKWVVARADLIFVNGKSGERYIRRFGFPPEKISQIPYTTDLDPFFASGSQGVQKTSRRFLFSGQLIPRKGLVEFLTVFSKWVSDHSENVWEFWCLGDGLLRESLRVFSLPENLHLLLIGNVDYSELPKYYGQADVFVFPTLADEWGIVVNEAMAAGLPVLGSIYSQAVEELVEDNKNGWLFRPDHEEEVYSALNRYFAMNDSDLMNMRRNVQSKVAAFKPEIIAEKFVRSLNL